MGLLALGAASVYGVDAAESATEVARKKAEGLSGISFEKMDIYSLTAPTGKRYDVGIVRGILHHL
jgi:2-polyprenyl-3-methyl-5-hydroxy-6-metoxy-1,4-benzoquinol methylase